MTEGTLEPFLVQLTRYFSTQAWYKPHWLHVNMFSMAIKCLVFTSSTPPPHAVRPSGLLCCGSDGLERTARRYLKTLLFLLLLAYKHIRSFAFLRYINPRLTLTLTTAVQTPVFYTTTRLNQKIPDAEKCFVLCKDC